MIKKVLVAMAMLSIAIGIAIAPARADTGEMYQCLNRSHVWDKRQCPEFKNGGQGPATFPGGGGGNRGGGILGGILGGLTGGLL